LATRRLRPTPTPRPNTLQQTWPQGKLVVSFCSFFFFFFCIDFLNLIGKSLRNAIANAKQSVSQSTEDGEDSTSNKRIATTGWGTTALMKLKSIWANWLFMISISSYIDVARRLSYCLWIRRSFLI
jgi:hypothetical protein